MDFVSLMLSDLFPQRVTLEDCDENSASCMIGVTLTSETDPLAQSGTCLGFFQVSKQLIHSGLVQHLRESLVHQLPSIPHCYNFLTKQGWPVSKGQEDSITSSNLLRDDGTITVISSYEKPRVGVKAKSGISLGFVFVSYNTHLDQLRQIVEEQLPFFRGLSSGYQFVDMNGWPISRDQEKKLTVLQTMVQSCVTVCTDVSMKALIEYKGDDNAMSIDSTDSEPIVKGQKQLPYHSKDEERHAQDSVPLDVAEHKQILISYVRAEASHHALQLKRALAAKGCSVFLDIHEIKMGVDWQDSLNYAVSNCEVFVPLITSRYGETQWTNREVKLADVLGKFILPVSFLDEWPPRCLAIQFATTQFVPWEKPISDHHSVFMRDDNPFHQRDVYKWNEESTCEVAMEIIERIRQHKDTHKKGAVFMKQRSVLRSYPNPLCGIDMQGIEEVNQNREGLPMVIIIAHQENLAHGQQLKKNLEEKNYDVWCTTEIETREDDLMSSLSDAVLLSPGVQSCISTDTNESILHSRKIFQDKANEAGVVILLVSSAFTMSKTCQQQVFYCEHRKRVIPVIIENLTVPGWLSLLIGSNKFEDGLRANYETNVMRRVKEALDPSLDDSFIEERNEVHLVLSVDMVTKRVNRDNALYISGSTRLHNTNSEEICRAIGKHLASLDSITVVTGGFYGVGEIVGRTFYEETQGLWKTHSVIHVLPRKDTKVLKDKADQNLDGTFNRVAYGQTIFTEGSVSDRECIVARAFDICVLIEGGPGSAHEAEQFAWNDHIVIPIRCTGGAANGMFGVPQKIFECPRDVEESDWERLNHPELSANDLGQAVAKIVYKLQRNNDSLKETDNDKVKRAPSQRRRKGLSMPADYSQPTLATMKTMILG